MQVATSDLFMEQLLADTRAADPECASSCTVAVNVSAATKSVMTLMAGKNRLARTPERQESLLQLWLEEDCSAEERHIVAQLAAGEYAGCNGKYLGARIPRLTAHDIILSIRGGKWLQQVRYVSCSISCLATGLLKPAHHLAASVSLEHCFWLCLAMVSLAK